jgi:phage terminase large subunit-like protein
VPEHLRDQGKLFGRVFGCRGERRVPEEMRVDGTSQHGPRHLHHLTVDSLFRHGGTTIGDPQGVALHSEQAWPPDGQVPLEQRCQDGLSRYFVPEENLRKRAERDRVPYDLWAAQGFIQATPGNVVDYGAIEGRIRQDTALFDVREIAYDPWNATHIALRLQDEGATMVEFRQGFRSMAAPTRELEKLIVSKTLAHGGNPVTRWMASNVAVAQDPAGNLKPAKDKSTERIDGIVAIVMALGRAMVAQEEPHPSYQMFFV